ncbi:MAG: hypothetical protein GY938_31685 [Ketobacter sp.]|nr:hypothetical protein [Ketobacter sp.]
MAAPLGNTNAVKGLRWRNAIDKALANRCKSDGQKALVEIAAQMLEKAAEGDMTAIKELGDRMDGKAPQAITVGGDESAPLVIKKVTFVSPTETS